MPLVFDPQAYRAVAETTASDAAFVQLRALGEALDLLTPEQRCDAIYADWLLQLNSPAHQALLQVRNLLIEKGALAANYLAELAQNADDASDGREAQIRIILHGEWLLVSNNGRKVTSLNLLGLCRFFVHAAGKVVKLNEQTIGRFGIGFKSCYKIASEVLVFTWDSEGKFGFRLPICREGVAASEPDRERLERLFARLQAVGTAQFDAELRDLQYLGYCTPEFLPKLPPELAQCSESLHQTERGALFCFHLRPDRRGEVASRITGQERELYELCPLFLPNLRLVQLAQHQIEMSVAGHDAAHDIAGLVEADRITLATIDISQLQRRQSKSRFWRLRGVAPGDLWQLALHADSLFRLRVEQEDDEHGTTIKDGSAYAFFPLNAVNWPFRLHLHLKLPTNLARSDWNPDDAAQIEEQIRRAVAGLAAWLEKHTDKWHPNWRLESLVARLPNHNECWALLIWGRLRNEANQKALIRTLTGYFTSSANAKSVSLAPTVEARAAWRTILRAIPKGNSLPQLVEAGSDVLLAAHETTSRELADLCVAACQVQRRNNELQRAGLIAILAVRSITSRAIGQVISAIECEMKDGTTCPLRELFEQPGGAELSAAWHETLSMLARWPNRVDWGDYSFFASTLKLQLEKLAIPQFNPNWREIHSRLNSEAAWAQHGEIFWKTPRLRCPESFCDSVLACIRVPAGDGHWLEITDLWLENDTPVTCFAGLLSKWPLTYTDKERKRITERLKEWGLFESWERRAKTRLRNELPGALTRALAENCQQDAFSRVFTDAFEHARSGLNDAWKAIVVEAEKVAVHRFLTERQHEDGLQDKILLSSQIPGSVRAAMALLPGHQDAPPWLTEAAWKLIRTLGLLDECTFCYLTSEVWAQNKTERGRELLENFYCWTAICLSEAQADGLNQLVSVASMAQRKDWTVGLSAHKRRPLRQLRLASPASPNPTVDERLTSRLLKKADWRVELLPSALAKVPAVAEACVQMNRLKLEAKLEMLTPIDSDQLMEDLRGDTDVIEALTNGMRRLFGSPMELNLSWLYEDEVAAVLNNADFVISGDKLVVNRYRAPADEAQCRRILAAFETHATPPPGYAADQCLSPFARYQRHREAIRSTLLAELVAKVGYEKHHVLRELMQNAESAYASKNGKTGNASFEFKVSETGVAGRRQVMARHTGRAFNEPDNEGKPRHDVERIWRLAAGSERTPEEVGRFNRGFKTLFWVACDGVVRVRSGQYDFEVIDLLLLRPAEPKPTVSPPTAITGFKFDVTVTDAWKMLGFNRSPNPSEALPVLNVSSFVFLRHLSRVVIRFEHIIWSWTLSRCPESDGWERIAILSEGSNEQEEFDVHSGQQPALRLGQLGKRFAVAVRLGRDGLPRLLEKAWRCFRLTFETDQAFPLDFLVNGDFEADQGRIGLRNIARSGLVEPAYEAVLSSAEGELQARQEKAVWIAWAKVLHLKEAARELEAAFGNDVRPFRRIAERAKEYFTTHIPHAGELVPASHLEFPTQLMRRLAGMFATQWGLITGRWVDPDIAALLPDTEQPRLNLPRWLTTIPPMSPILQTVQKCLRSFSATRPNLDAIEQDELQQADVILEEKLRPTTPPQISEPPLLVVAPLTVAKLWHWWKEKEKAVANYTLDGENWTLLYPGDETIHEQRAVRLRRDLSRPATDDGRRIWYRLLGLACLMSAGWGRISTLREFWRGTLEAADFWDRTANKEFADETRALFSTLVMRTHPNAAASGEAADYWRHIFYDIRKVHELVWQHEFADTVLRMASDPARAHELPQFLRSGQIIGQKPWAGVLGQSAGAPLFFVVRELCRLGVVNSPALKPLAFFACSPVRRAAVRIGWLDSVLAARTDFQSLAEVSERLHFKIEADKEFGQRLLEFYDIPLLHLGLTE